MYIYTHTYKEDALIPPQVAETLIYDNDSITYPMYVQHI